MSEATPRLLYTSFEDDERRIVEDQQGRCELIRGDQNHQHEGDDDVRNRADGYVQGGENEVIRVVALFLVVDLGVGLVVFVVVLGTEPQLPQNRINQWRFPMSNFVHGDGSNAGGQETSADTLLPTANAGVERLFLFGFLMASPNRDHGPQQPPTRRHCHANHRCCFEHGRQHGQRPRVVTHT